jgi:drug/metabolite transporter (DMT)-like permease
VNKPDSINSARPSQAFAVFGVLFAATCWGVIWYPYRLLAEAGVSGVAASFYTYGLAMLLVGIYYVKYWRGMFKVPRSIIWLSLAAGWTNLSYVLAVIDGEVMRVMLLFYLSPLWTLILAHFLLKEKTHITGYIAIAAALLGAFIMLHDPALTGLPLPRNNAEWLGLSAGMGFSLTNVITRQSTHLSIRAKSFAIWVGVLLVALLLMPFVHHAYVAPSVISLSQWGLMLLIACALIAATFLVQIGVTQMTATRASVLFVFELVVAAVAAYFLAQETMDSQEWMGGALIIAAAIFAASNHQK